MIEYIEDNKFEITYPTLQEQIETSIENLRENIKELTSNRPNQNKIGSEKLTAINKLLKILQQPLSHVLIKNTH